MTTNDANDATGNAHDEVFKLIPWYVKGKLSTEEHDQVEWHLAICEICRNEALSCQNLTKTMPQPAEAWKPSAAHFAGILAEVEKLEASAVIHPEKSLSRPKAKGWFPRFKEAIAVTPLSMRWTLAFETLVIAGLVAIAILPAQYARHHQETAFETLSNADKPMTTKGSLIKLVLADDMTTRELTALLAENGLQLRDGPSVVGVYIAETPSTDVEKTLAALKAHPKVRLALLMNL